MTTNTTATASNGESLPSSPSALPLPSLRYHKSDYAVAGSKASCDDDDLELDDLIGSSSRNDHHLHQNESDGNGLIEHFMDRLGLSGGSVHSSARQSILSMTSSITLTDFDEDEVDDIYEFMTMTAAQSTSTTTTLTDTQQDEDNDCVPTCPARRVSLQSQQSQTQAQTPTASTTTTNLAIMDCMPKRPGRRTSENTCRSIPENVAAADEPNIDELVTSLHSRSKNINHDATDCMPKRPKRRHSDSTCRSIPEESVVVVLESNQDATTAATNTLKVDYGPMIPNRRSSAEMAATAATTCQQSSVVSRGA